MIDKQQSYELRSDMMINKGQSTSNRIMIDKGQSYEVVIDKQQLYEVIMINKGQTLK